MDVGDVGAEKGGGRGWLRYVGEELVGGGV